MHSSRLLSVAGLATALALHASVPSQSASYATALTADVDGAATETGGFQIAIPGVADDLRMFGDGQFVVRADGTARLSTFVHRASAIDREFFVQLEFAGRSAPGDANYPPVGCPVLTLQPSAYLPAGAIDPATYVYWTQVTGTFTGLRTYAGALLTVVNQGAAQTGPGASNKNVLPGLAVDLAITVTQQPSALTFVPTGPAQLRATIATDVQFCATHVDADPSVSSGPARRCLSIPGVGTDFVFLPVGQWVEATDGTASLTGVVRRQSDHTDEWSLALSLSGRVDPGSPAHPPAGSPVQQLLPTAYTNQGGPIDPAAWHYYTVASGTLTGSGINAGGSIQLAPVGAVQVGTGADQGNVFVGLSCDFTAASVTQPTSRTVTVTGDLELRVNTGLSCLIPLPQVSTGILQTLPTVTEHKVIYTGTDLGWVTWAAVGPRSFGIDPREWFNGSVRIVDHDTVELSIPQGMAPATYPVRLFTVGGLSNPLTLDLTAPTSITLRTEDTRAIGEDQHWVIHQGPIVAPVFSFLLLSLSNVPSDAPGIFSVDIGDSFASLIIFAAAFHDPATGVGTVPLNDIAPGLTGLRFHAQAVAWDTSNANFFPLLSSNAWFTDYL